MILIFIPQAIVFYNADIVLIALGQNPQVAQMALQYTRIVMLGVLFFNLYEATRRYLNAQLIFVLPSKIQFTTLILHILWCYIFIDVLNLSIIGAGISTLITYFLGKFEC